MQCPYCEKEVIDIDGLFEHLVEDSEHINTTHYKCEHCSYFHVYEQYHPYGSTYAAEILTDCLVDKPENCLIIQEALKYIDNED